MDTEQVKFKRQEIVEKFGDWTAHPIHLQDDVYTYDTNRPEFRNQLIGYAIHLRRIIQIVSDLTNQPLSKLRVLDLACLEGLYGIEFARHGAEVVAIEAREANIEKARFAKDILQLDNISFVQDDVRNLSVEKYGHFDVVLCMGILYHLDVPDVFQFMKSISSVCKRVTVIDTHIALSINKTHLYENQEFSGWTYTEFPPDTAKEEKLKWLWASLDNEKSFWFTRPSLYKLLFCCDFTSVYTCNNPPVPGGWEDRDTLVALKGDHQELFSTPGLNFTPTELWLEVSTSVPHPSQKAYLDSLLVKSDLAAERTGGSLRGTLRKVRALVKRVLHL